MSKIWVCSALLLLVAGCRQPTPPDTDRPPEPQAEANQVREALVAPLEKAEAADRRLQEAAQAQRAVIEAAGG